LFPKDGGGRKKTANQAGRKKNKRQAIAGVPNGQSPSKKRRHTGQSKKKKNHMTKNMKD